MSGYQPQLIQFSDAEAMRFFTTLPKPRRLAILLSVSGIGLCVYFWLTTHYRLHQKYQQLEAMLHQQNWFASDVLTLEIALTLSGQSQTLTPQDLARFPCRHLLRLDRLWQTHSDRRFGFTPQHQLWLTQGKQVNRATDQALAQHLGWLRPEDPRQGFDYPTQSQHFSITSPPGHLPFYLYCCLSWDAHKNLWFLDDRIVISTLAQRYDQCL